MNNIDKEIINKLVPRIFKIINNMPENMDANIFNNIFDENEKLKINNNKLLAKLKDLQKRKDNNEHKMINVYHNLKKKIDKLQNENFDLQSREYMLLSEYEHHDKSIKDYQEIINKKDIEIKELKLQNDELNNKIIFRKKEDTQNINLQINKITSELSLLKNKYTEELNMNNGYKKLIENYKEDLKICEEKNIKNIDLIKTIQNEKKQIETKMLSLTQNIKLVSEENDKLKDDIEILKNQKSSSVEQLITKLKNEIEDKNKEIDRIKNNLPDTNIITKLNEVIEKQNNEFKLLENIYKASHEENEKLKLENIELQVEIKHLMKSDYDTDYETDYTSEYDTDYESESDEDETTEIKKNNKQIFRFKQRKFRQPTQDFFDNLLLEEQNRDKTKEVVIKEPENYTYSTDYHVDLLHNSNKLVPKEERKTYSNKQMVNISPQKEIFIKNEVPNEINNEMDIIINKKNDNIIIKPDEPIINNIGGGNKKDRFTIHDIEGTLKMFINNDFSTITDQNIDKNDINLGRKIYNRKNVRRCRNKNN